MDELLKSIQENADFWLTNKKRIEAAGYVKVVRCGECKFKRDCERIIIKSNETGAEDIDYCSAGEPKEEDHE